MSNPFVYIPSVLMKLGRLRLGRRVGNRHLLLTTLFFDWSISAYAGVCVSEANAGSSEASPDGAVRLRCGSPRCRRVLPVEFQRGTGAVRDGETTGVQDREETSAVAVPHSTAEPQAA